MNVTHDPMGVVEGRALLRELPELCFEVLKHAHIEVQPGEGVRCSFELPEVGRRTNTANTARAAIRAALLDLSNVLTTSPVQEWPEAWHQLAGSVAPCVARNPLAERNEVERFQAKARQLTIGVTMPAKLKTSIQAIADAQETSFANVARELAAVGFEDFDDRTFSESSDDLFALLASEVQRWLPSEKEQVMLRLEPSLGIRLRSTAKEHGKSASEFGALFLAHGYELKAQLVALEHKVSTVRGPAVRDLARSVGLDGYVALLSSVLAGSVAAPRKLQKQLSVVFESSEQALVEFFRRSFESRAVPAFKAERGKPHMVVKPASWEEAVKSLNLPSEKAQQLLELND